MENLIVNVYNKDLEWKAQIEDIESFTHRTSWHEIAYSEMKISKRAQGVEELEIGNILVVNNDKHKALIIEEKHTNLVEDFWTISLLPLKGMLNYRICHPVDSGSFTARKQSEVMMIIPFNNLVSQTRDADRKFLDSANVNNMFGVTDLKIYGDTIDFTVDWNTGYMGDAIVSIAKMYEEGEFPIGWNIYINDTWTQLVMDTYQGTNRTIHQGTVPPVVFSEEYGNIKDANYIYSIKEWRNVVYMIYTTEGGGAPTSVPVGNTTHGATISFLRKEIVIHSSKKFGQEVYNEGKSEVNKRPHIESFTAEIINNKNTMSTYNEHWFLGDIVTVQAKLLGDTIISVDAQITEIEEIYDGGEYSINVTFGEGKLSFVQLIKNAINQK